MLLQAGNIIPGSESSNNRVETAGKFCTSVAEGWTFANGQVCISDPVNPRILAGDTVAPIAAGASPEACTAACDALGFTFAGVEFGSECHCGTGFTQSVFHLYDVCTQTLICTRRAITTVPHPQCSMTCAGNSSESCGGPGLIQVFAGPNPPRAAQLPPGWSAFADAPCAQDSAARMFTDTLIAGPALAATDTPAACVNFCVANGFDKAGVEGGDECYCGSTFRDTPHALDPSQCNLSCQGAIGITCGGNFAIQLYTS